MMSTTSLSLYVSFKVERTRNPTLTIRANHDIFYIHFFFAWLVFWLVYFYNSFFIIAFQDDLLD